MQYIREKSDGEEMITLAGELTISSADELKDVLIKALSVNERISINLEQSTEIDLSCLQLLCSAHRTAIKNKKSLSRIGACPNSLKNITEQAGFLRHKGCVRDVNDGCLWAGI